MTWERLRERVRDAVFTHSQTKPHKGSERPAWLEADTLTISEDVAKAIPDFPLNCDGLRFCGLAVAVSSLLAHNTVVVTIGPLQGVDVPRKKRPT